MHEGKNSGGGGGAFKEGRTQKVVVEGASSDPSPVKSGVPHGLVLGLSSHHTLTLDGRKVGHFLITIQKSFKLIIN